jgi:hypothetical protein
VAPFKEHSKVAPGSSEENLKSAVVLRVVVGGPDSIVVSGATTVHL